MNDTEPYVNATVVRLHDENQALRERAERAEAVWSEFATWLDTWIAEAEAPRIHGEFSVSDHQASLAALYVIREYVAARVVLGTEEPGRAPS